MPHFVHRFGEYRVDPLRRELHRGDLLLSLSPKVFDCIAYLIDQRDRAVGRDELIAAVWGRADVSDDVLAQTLLRARRAVGDTGNEQRAIRTIPRFGYRWVEAVETAETPGPREATKPPAAAPERALPAFPGDGSSGPRVRVRRALRAGGVAFAFVLVAAGALLYRTRESPRHGIPATQDALLVLPVNVSGDAREAAWIRLGAMDYIASRLREDANLKVLPSSQTLALVGRDDAQDPHDAGELHRLELATHAAYIIAPRANFSAGRWRMTLDVYHASGASRYEADAASPLEATAQATVRFLASLGVSVAAPRTGAAPDTELVQRIDAAMLAGDLDAARGLVDAAPAALRKLPAVAVRTGQIAFRAGQLDTARALFAPLAGDDPALAASVRAQAQMGLGAVAVRRQEFGDAARSYAAAIETLGHAGATPDPVLLGDAYMGRGVANGAQDRFDDALGDLGRARVELERAGDRIGAASVDVNLGIIDGNRGRYAEAESAFDRAIATFTRFGVRDNLAAALLGKGGAQLALVDHAGALASSAQASDLAAHLENPILVERIAANRARALLAAGQLDAAGKLLQHFPGDNEDAEPSLLRAELLLERGDAAAAAGAAGDLLARIGAPAAAVRDDVPVAEVAYLLLEAARRSGRVTAATPALAALGAEPASAGDRERSMVRELVQAQLAAARGDAGAPDHFVAALADADRHGAPDALVRCGVAYIHYLIGQRSFEQATAVVGRLAPYADQDYRAARATAALHEALGDRRLADAAQAQVHALAGERDVSLPW
jgi:DNA-binding winged helix-turn-helix (wHTH) protein/tetratricopeptide (TPR) repeat protein